MVMGGNKLGELFVPIIVDMQGLDRQLDTVRAKLERVGRGFTSVGRSMAAVAAPIASLGVVSFKAAMDFESSFAGVRKTVDATEEEFAMLADGFRNMAKEIPISVNELNKIGEAAGQLGIEADNILGFTRVMADLGVTTNMSSEEAATALARLANITQMPQTEFDRLGATIVDLGNNLATTEREIVEMGLRIAGAGSQIGLTEAQILSFAGALSSVGIEAEAGGTAISRVMIQMANEVASGGEKLKGFAEVAGMSVDEFKAAFETDAAGAIIAFIEGLGRMSEAGENVFVTLEELELGEIRVRDALLRASGAGDLFSESLRIGSRAWEENSALTEEASRRYETTASQMQIFRNRIMDVAITVGGPLLESVNKMMQAVQPLIDRIAAFAEEHTRLTQFVIMAGVALGGLATALVGIGLILGPLTAAIAGVGTAIGLLLSPIGLVVLAIAGLATALVLAWQRSEEFRTIVMGVFEQVKEAVVNALQVARDVVTEVLAFIQGLWEQHGQRVLEVVTTAMETVAQAFQTALQIAGQVVTTVLTAIQEFWRRWGDEILTIVRGLFGSILATWQASFETIMEVVRSVLTRVQEFWAQWGEQVMAVVKGVLTFLVGLIGSTLEAIAQSWAAHGEQVMGIVGRVFEVIGTIITTAIDTIFTVIETFLRLVQEAWARWGEDIMRILTTMWELITTLFQVGVDAVSTIITTALDQIREFWANWGDEIMTVLKIFWQLVTDLVQTTWNTIQDVIGGALTTIRGILNTVMGLITGDWARAWQGIQNIVQGVANALKGIINGIIGSVEGLINAAIRGINAFSFKVPDFPGIPRRGETIGFNISPVRLPRLAAGGLVTDATIAMLGEGGRDELVLPLGDHRVQELLGGRGPMVENLIINSPRPLTPIEAKRQVERGLRSLRLRGVT